MKTVLEALEVRKTDYFLLRLDSVNAVEFDLDYSILFSLQEKLAEYDIHQLAKAMAAELCKFLAITRQKTTAIGIEGSLSFFMLDNIRFTLTLQSVDKKVLQVKLSAIDLSNWKLKPPKGMAKAKEREEPEEEQE